jgi:hypothetical protein
MGDVFTVRATGVTKKVLILIEKVNKNYGLPVERLYGRRILENHNFRKNSTAPIEKTACHFRTLRDFENENYVQTSRDQRIPVDCFGGEPHHFPGNNQDSIFSISTGCSASIHVSSAGYVIRILRARNTAT